MCGTYTCVSICCFSKINLMISSDFLDISKISYIMNTNYYSGNRICYDKL